MTRFSSVTPNKTNRNPSWSKKMIVNELDWVPTLNKLVFGKHAVVSRKYLYFCGLFFKLLMFINVFFLSCYLIHYICWKFQIKSLQWIFGCISKSSFYLRTSSRSLPPVHYLNYFIVFLLSIREILNIMTCFWMFRMSRILWTTLGWTSLLFYTNTFFNIKNVGNSAQ